MKAALIGASNRIISFPELHDRIFPLWFGGGTECLGWNLVESLISDTTMASMKKCIDSDPMAVYIEENDFETVSGNKNIRR
ncbi:hypothetical protein CEXT_757671 [Caerostris extrusa]|uniref:Cytochrome P450 n=1 Tax=Caerostris extrusa TaxID=172846 RepID=A0AAV4YD33_CAEEX|nr:hypothetical protein CEXT_757671 [Caerostris extrusa]